jgi:hypothetical protein
LTAAEVALLDDDVRGWNIWRLKHLVTLAARANSVAVYGE